MLNYVSIKQSTLGGAPKYFTQWKIGIDLSLTQCKSSFSHWLSVWQHWLTMPLALNILFGVFAYKKDFVTSNKCWRFFKSYFLSELFTGRLRYTKNENCSPKRVIQIARLSPVRAAVCSRWNGPHPNRGANCGTASAGNSSLR